MSDFASGSVIRSLPGQTAFPVRLAREMYEQAQFYRLSEGFEDPCLIYDPCCGGGYLLTTLGIIYNPEIRGIIASDISPQAIKLTRANLALITSRGLDARIAELEVQYNSYGKESHLRALDSARILRGKLTNPVIYSHSFQADARSETDLHKGLNELQPEIVISDLPYASSVHWRNLEGEIVDPVLAVEQTLSALHSMLAPAAIVALAISNRQKISHPQYVRLRQMPLGKRRITWLKRM